jgi:hypothetical protein
MTINGTINGPGWSYTGLLFQGEVSAYRMTESAADSNSLNLNDTAYVRVTGGWLMTNDKGMTTPENHLYWLDATAIGCSQDSGDLDKFSGTTFTSAAAVTGFALNYWMPEPASALFVIIGAFLTLVPRRRYA